MIDGEVRIVDGKRVPVYKTQISLSCLIDVECGTNGPQGGDSGHGCRTYIRIADAGGVDVIRATVQQDKASNAALTLVLGGDDELRAVIRACDFIARILKLQIMEAKA